MYAMTKMFDGGLVGTQLIVGDISEGGIPWYMNLGQVKKGPFPYISHVSVPFNPCLKPLVNRMSITRVHCSALCYSEKYLPSYLSYLCYQ